MAKVVSRFSTKTPTLLRKGDQVMVIAGGSGTTRPNKGKVGKIVRVIEGERVVVDGVNMTSRVRKARAAGEKNALVKMEAPIHISNVMYYSEKLKAPVRLKSKKLADGKKVRGYKDKKSGQFEQIDV